MINALYEITRATRETIKNDIHERIINELHVAMNKNDCERIKSLINKIEYYDNCIDNEIDNYDNCCTFIAIDNDNNVQLIRFANNKKTTFELL